MKSIIFCKRENRMIINIHLVKDIDPEVAGVNYIVIYDKYSYIF